MEESLSNNDSTDSVKPQKSHEYSSPSISRRRRPFSENNGDSDDRPTEPISTRGEVNATINNDLVDAGESSSSSSDYHLVYFAGVVIKVTEFNAFTFPIWFKYSVLCGLFVSSFVISGLVMRHELEDPILVDQTLSFDYIRNGVPVAYVPIISCPRVTSSENFDVGMSPGRCHTPPNRRMRVLVSLTLPDTRYNQRIRNFQVKLEFLSSHSFVTVVLPAVPKYTSLPIHFLLAFFKAFPFATRFLSESQTVNVGVERLFLGGVMSWVKVMIEPGHDIPEIAAASLLIESELPLFQRLIWSWVKVMIEPGHDIPEIAAASLLIESELPLFKRLIWSWKKTAFLSIALVVFVTELLFALICRRSVVRVRTGNASSHHTARQVQASKLGFTSE